MSDDDCIFCKIVAGEIPSTEVYSDGGAYAFEDLDPKAPVHVLVVTREHFTDIAEVGAHADASAALLAGVRGVAAQLGLSDFRTVFNTGAGVGQSVFHVHGHVLAGRPMGWPPG